MRARLKREGELPGLKRAERYAKADMVLVSVALKRNTAERLGEYALHEGTDRGSLIREIIDEWILLNDD